MVAPSVNFAKRYAVAAAAAFAVASVASPRAASAQVVQDAVRVRTVHSIPVPLYYLDGVRVSAEVGTTVPATEIAMVQVTQPASPQGARSIIRITSMKAAEKKLDAVAAASDGAALLANAPQAALYTSIAQVVAGTDSVEQVDAIFIGKLSIRVAAPPVVPARSSERGRSERGGR